MTKEGVSKSADRIRALVASMPMYDVRRPATLDWVLVAVLGLADILAELATLLENKEEHEHKPPTS